MEIHRILEYENKVMNWLDELASSGYKPKQKSGNLNNFADVSTICKQIANKIDKEILSDSSETSCSVDLDQLSLLMNTVQNLSQTVLNLAQGKNSLQPTIISPEDVDEFVPKVSMSDQQKLVDSDKPKTRVSSLKIIRKSIKNLNSVDWISKELSDLFHQIEFWYESRFYYKSVGSSFHYNYNTIFQYMSEIVISYCDAVIHNKHDEWIKDFSEWCVSVKCPESDASKYPVPSFVHCPIQSGQLKVSALAGKAWNILYSKIKADLSSLVSTDVACEAWSRNYLSSKQDSSLNRSTFDEDLFLSKYGGDSEEFYGSWSTIYSIYKKWGKLAVEHYIQNCDDYGSVASNKYGDEIILKEIIQTVRSATGEPTLSKSLMNCVHSNHQDNLFRKEV